MRRNGASEERTRKKKLQIKDLKGDGELGEWEREVSQSARALETAFGVKGKSGLHHVT